MQFLEASAEMTRWLIAHVPSRRKHPSVALLGQTYSPGLPTTVIHSEDLKAIPSDDRELF